MRLFEYYNNIHIDVHLGMSDVSHTCRPVLYIVSVYIIVLCFLHCLLKGLHCIYFLHTAPSFCPHRPV